MTKVELAIKIALFVHAGQVDKGGYEYILHPLRVASQFIENEDAIITAILHDCIEDCRDATTVFPLIDKVANKKIWRALNLLTREKKTPYMEYIKKIKRNKLARDVKIADLLDNLNPYRSGRTDSQIKKYEEALNLLIH